MMKKRSKNGIEIDWSKLDGMLTFDPTKEFCSYILGVSNDTLERRIKAKYQMTFTEYKATKVEVTASKLKQKIIKLALDGNVTCLIFSLKNIAGWSDNNRTQVETATGIVSIEAF